MLNNKANIENKTNIMLVISSLGGGGAEMVVSNLCRNIDSKQFRISVCYLKELGEKGDELLRRGYDIVNLPCRNKGVYKYLRFFKLRRIILQNKIKLLHSHNLEPLFECALCKIITPKIKLIHTFHFGNYPYLPFRYLLLEFFYSRVANKLVAVGKAQKKEIVNTYRLNQENIEIIYNGVNEIENEDTGIKKKLIKTSEITVIGSICTFIHQKGLDYLLHIAKEMMYIEKKVIFWVVGDGPLRPKLEEQKRILGIDKIVKFFGWIPDASKTILPSMDIFLQTSRWEAMSMVILEALASGKPIVATDVGENRSIIEEAGAGFIVKPGDVHSTVECLKKLIEQKELRRKMGRRGKIAVLKQYNVKKMARQYESLYAQILGIK
jgi:glycosyltransferase involved in cell wall biosynthesis